MSEMRILRDIYEKGRGGDPLTVYSVSRMLGISRHRAETALIQLQGDGMLHCFHVFHRPDVTKRVFEFTDTGRRIASILSLVSGSDSE